MSTEPIDERGVRPSDAPGASVECREDPALLTGDLSFDRYVAVDDCSVQIEPTLVEGQIVSGVVQSVGQALYEETVYDESGNLATGSLQD